MQSVRVEIYAFKDLRHLEVNRPHTGVESLGSEAIGGAEPGGGVHLGLGLEHVGAFLAYGFVDQKAEAFGEAIRAFAGEELQNGSKQFSIDLVGHVWGFGWMCLLTLPTENHAGPLPTNFAQAPPSGRSERLALLPKDFYIGSPLPLEARKVVLPINSMGTKRLAEFVILVEEAFLQTDR